MTSNALCASPDSAVKTETITVKLNGVPGVTLTELPGSHVCAGTTVLFNAALTFGGYSPTFNWYKNGVSLPFVTGTSFSYVPANGDAVSCTIHSNYTCRLVDSVNSGNMVVTVEAPSAPSVSISAFPGTSVASGENVMFTAAVTGAAPVFTYQWFINSAAVAGATSATYATNMLANGDTVTCMATNQNTCAYSSGASIVMRITTGVAQAQGSTAGINLYPNPTSGSFTIAAAGGGVCTIYTLEGKELMSSKLMAGTNILSLPAGTAAGIYLCRYTGNDGSTAMIRLVYEQ